MRGQPGSDGLRLGYAKAVQRGDKLNGAYLAEFDRALAWAALAAPEKAPMSTGAEPEVEKLTQ